MLALVGLQGRVAFLPFCEISLKTANPKPYPTDPKTVGGHLKKRRYELGLRQKDVACRLGVNEDTILNWERGKTLPPVRLVPRIIRFLGYNPYPAPHTLGEQLLTQRRRLGLSRKHMARELGVDVGTLKRWERGTSRPIGARLRLVKDLLGTDD